MRRCPIRRKPGNRWNTIGLESAIAVGKSSSVLLKAETDRDGKLVPGRTAVIYTQLTSSKAQQRGLVASIVSSLFSLVSADSLAGSVFLIFR